MSSIFSVANIPSVVTICAARLVIFAPPSFANLTRSSSACLCQCQLISASGAVVIVMLGGTYIFGGRGSIAGTFLAAWLLVILATGMTVANIAINAQLTVLGLLLIVSIIATNAIYSRTQR